MPDGSSAVGLSHRYVHLQSMFTCAPLRTQRSEGGCAASGEECEGGSGDGEGEGGEGEGGGGDGEGGGGEGRAGEGAAWDAVPSPALKTSISEMYNAPPRSLFTVTHSPAIGAPQNSVNGPGVVSYLFGPHCVAPAAADAALADGPTHTVNP